VTHSHGLEHAVESLIKQLERTHEQKSASITLVYDEPLQTMRTNSMMVKSDLTAHSLQIQKEVEDVTKVFNTRLAEMMDTFQTETKTHADQQQAQM
jgi:hypothetical protein